MPKIIPDIETLNAYGKFLDDYGFIGVSIFLSIFIIFLLLYFRKQLKEKDIFYKKLLDEKEKILIFLLVVILKIVK